MKRLEFRRTTVIMVGLGAFLVGLGIGKKIEFVHPLLLIVGLAPFIITIKRLRIITFVTCAVCCLMFGWWRGAAFHHQILPYQSLYGQTVVIEALASTDGTYNDKGLLEFDVNNVTFEEPFSRRLPGKLKIETIGLPATYRGDRLKITGNIYPAGGSRQGSIKYAQAVVIKRDKSWLNRLRLKLIAGMQSALPEPQASFGLGLLIGQRTTLPDDISEQLAAVGLTHIIAVSGYNLTIIVRFVHGRLGRRSKYQIVMLSLLLISTFLLITGFSASIVRAAIVSGLGLGAWYYGRTFRSVLLLLLAAALTAGWYPIYLWSDIGWYLSFLAFFGVLVLAPLITKRFWKRQPWGVMPTIIESSCAIIMTAPLVMYIFKQVSIIALPANALVVPLVPYAMVASAVAGMAGIWLTHIASWIAWPAQILLAGMLEIAELFSRLPNALVRRTLPMPVMVGVYMVLVVVAGLLWVKTRPKFAKVTDVNTEI